MGIGGVPNTPLSAGFPLAVAFAAVNENVINGIVNQLSQNPQLAPLIPLAQRVLRDPAVIPQEFIPVETVTSEGDPFTLIGGKGNLLSFINSL